MIDIEEVNKNGRILAWHGAQKWDGLPEIKAHKKGTYEYGPGIYFTNHCSTAQKYAKGPGSIMLMEIECPRLLTIKDKVPLEDAIKFYESCFRLKNKKSVLNDLQRNVRDGLISVDTLINCGVNNEALAGSHGPALAEWLTERGFDASIGRSQANNEEWMIVFNPKISGTAIFAISSTVLTIDFSCESVIIKTRNGWCRAKVRVCTRPGDCRDTLRNSQSVFRIVWRSEGKVYGSKKREKVYVGYPSRGLYRTVQCTARIFFQGPVD